MPPTPPRRLNLGDGMILVAGVAVGIALTRWYLISSYHSSIPAVDKLPEYWFYMDRIVRAARIAMIWLAVLSPTWLMILLHQSRSNWRRPLRRPGAAASLAATLLLGIEGIVWITATAIEGQGITSFLDNFNYDWRFAPAGAAIAGVWLCAVITQRWHPEGGIVDRFGRFLGVCWIVVFLCFLGATTQERLMIYLEIPNHTLMLNQQTQAEESAYKTYVDQTRQYHREQHAYLDHLLQSKDPSQIERFLTDQIQTLETERATFEANEQARNKAMINPPLSSPPPPPFPSNAPIPPGE